MSLYVRMLRQFGRSAVYPDPSDGDTVEDAPQLMTDVLFDRWKARGDEIQVVVGHFPLCTAELLGGGFTTLTVLRHPVDRTLSYLRHHRNTTPDDSERSLEEIYEDPLRFDHFIQNHMVKMLSLRAEEMTDGMMTKIEFDRGRLRQAKRALRKIDEFGLQDELESFAQRLERRFLWELGPPVHENVTEPVAVPDSFRARIAEDNRLDVELYEYARKLLSRRLRSGP